jgi:hypothetical protein
MSVRTNMSKYRGTIAIARGMRVSRHESTRRSRRTFRLSRLSEMAVKKRGIEPTEMPSESKVSNHRAAELDNCGARAAHRITLGRGCCETYHGKSFFAQ